MTETKGASSNHADISSAKHNLNKLAEAGRIEHASFTDSKTGNKFIGLIDRDSGISKYYRVGEFGAMQFANDDKEPMYYFVMKTDSMRCIKGAVVVAKDGNTTRFLNNIQRIKNEFNPDSYSKGVFLDYDGKKLDSEAIITLDCLDGISAERMLEGLNMIEETFGKSIESLMRWDHVEAKGNWIRL